MENKTSPAFYETPDGKEIICTLCCGGDKDPCFSCCGTEMKKMVPNTTDGAKEKHVPVVTRDGDKVKVAVGDIYHPMEEDHSIAWIYLETCCGGRFRKLKPGQEPTAVFPLAEGETPVAAYAYCNLHGFWKTDIA